MAFFCFENPRNVSPNESWNAWTCEAAEFGHLECCGGRGSTSARGTEQPLSAPLWTGSCSAEMGDEMTYTAAAEGVS